MTAIPVPAHSLVRFMRLAKVMEWLTTAGIVAIAVVAAIIIFVPDWMLEFAVARLGPGAAGFQITPLGQVLGGVVLAVPVGVMLYGLIAARRVFADFARGELISEDAARHLQIFATTVLVQAPLSLFTSAGLSLALSIGDPSGRRALMIGFSSNDYFALIVGGVLLAAVTVMREAARIADENASIV